MFAVCIAEDHTQSRKLAVLHKFDELGVNKTKVARKCGMSRQCVQDEV